MMITSNYLNYSSNLNTQDVPHWTKTVDRNVDSDNAQQNSSSRNQRTATNPNKSEINDQAQIEKNSLIQKLKQRDSEVRQHELAHATVGGQYAGNPTYTYQKGPDGQLYAVGGQVSIDHSPVPGDPDATIAKARVVQRAALAPASPSPQDMRIASKASQMEAQARMEKHSKSIEENKVEKDDDYKNDSRRINNAFLKSFYNLYNGYKESNLFFRYA